MNWSVENFPVKEFIRAKRCGNRYGRIRLTGTITLNALLPHEDVQTRPKTANAKGQQAYSSEIIARQRKSIAEVL